MRIGKARKSVSGDPVRDALVSALSAEHVHFSSIDTALYARDASVIDEGATTVVCFPATTAEVQACVRAAVAHGRPFVARGSGTGLAGGAVPCGGAVVIATTRMDTIHEVDIASGVAWVGPGVLNLDVPAGKVVAEYTMDGEYVESVRITNVPSFLHSRDLEIDCPGLGKLTVDVAYGGNFYCIVDPQQNFTDLADVSVGDLLRWSPALRTAMNERYSFVHPENDNIRGCTHIMWTGKPLKDGSTARNAVFYGDKAIDRSPCGTGTSARMAQWYARGRLKVGDAFIHESIIGSIFKGRVEKAVRVGNVDGIVPSIAGWARQTGINTIFIDDRDPFAHGFSLV